jgi:leishmanolysin
MTNAPTVNDGWHQMRIFVDYTYGTKFRTANPGIDAKFQMSMRLVESVRSYFEKYLTVNYSPSMVFPGGTCYNNKVDAFNKPIDLFITVAPENDPSTDYFAAATPCYLSPRDGRPTMGAYILNLAFLDNDVLSEYLYFSTFAHEFTHILGFSDNLFPKYVRPGTTTKRTDVVSQITIGKETFSAITMPEVVSFAKTYFGCSNIPALPLENNGGDGSAGSHWEKLFLPQEYMNPTVENPGILSEFTMTLLRATGWYQIDANAAQRYDWGQGAGCGIFNICPQAGTGYCSAAQVSQSICSSEWMSKVKCL